MLLSLTSGLDAVTAAAAGLGQASLGSPPTGQDLAAFIASWQSLLATAASVARILLDFVSPYWLTESEQKQLAASVAACAACSQLVRLWREQQSGLITAVTRRNLSSLTDDSLRLALNVMWSMFGIHAMLHARGAGADPAALAQAAALSAQLRPERVLGWLRCTLDGVDWVMSTAGGQLCCFSFIGSLGACACALPYFK